MTIIDTLLIIDILILIPLLNWNRLMDKVLVLEKCSAFCKVLNLNIFKDFPGPAGPCRSSQPLSVFLFPVASLVFSSSDSLGGTLPQFPNLILLQLVCLRF